MIPSEAQVYAAWLQACRNGINVSRQVVKWMLMAANEASDKTVADVISQDTQIRSNDRVMLGMNPIQESPW